MQNCNLLPDFRANSIGTAAKELLTHMKPLSRYLIRVFYNTNNSFLDI